MTDFRTFKTGEILTDAERAKLSPVDRKSYDLEQKIRGLMKLADSPSASEGERENATRMIAKLITKHQIDISQLRSAEKTGPAKIISFEIFVSNRYGLGGIRATAIHRAVLTPLGGTSVKWHHASHSTKKDTRVACFISEDLADFAKMLIASLLLQMETGMFVASRQHQRELKDNWLPANAITKQLGLFRKGYLFAWGDAVGARVSRGREDARQEAERETGKEIVLASDAERSRSAMEAWHDDLYGSKMRKSRTVYVSQTGKIAGREDGRKAQLGINEVGGQRARALT